MTIRQRKVGYCCWHTDSCSAMWDWAEVDCKRVKEELWCGCVGGVPVYTEQDLSATRSSQPRPRWVLSVFLVAFDSYLQWKLLLIFLFFSILTGLLEGRPHTSFYYSTKYSAGNKRDTKKNESGAGENSPPQTLISLVMLALFATRVAANCTVGGGNSWPLSEISLYNFLCNKVQLHRLHMPYGSNSISPTTTAFEINKNA